MVDFDLEGVNSTFAHAASHGVPIHEHAVEDFRACVTGLGVKPDVPVHTQAELARRVVAVVWKLWRKEVSIDTIRPAVFRIVHGWPRGKIAGPISENRLEPWWPPEEFWTKNRRLALNE